MPELRKDPLTGRWVIIAKERGRRTQDLKVKSEHQEVTICPFCEGNESNTPPEICAIRDGSKPRNSKDWQIRVVPNMFPALAIEGEFNRTGVGMFDIMNGIGAHEVVIEHPKHLYNYTEMPVSHIIKILETYKNRIEDLYRDHRLRYVLVFKNYGSAAGATLAHAHSQIIATPVTPINVKNELNVAKNHYKTKERCIYCDMMKQELLSQDRVVSENEQFVCITPFASRFPFELMIMPKKHSHTFQTITNDELYSLSLMFKDVLFKIKESLNDPAYNIILHSSPNLVSRPGYSDFWSSIMYDFHWHFEIMPRLSNTAGFEWGSGFYINPTAPEDAAKYLKDIKIKNIEKEVK